MGSLPGTALALALLTSTSFAQELVPLLRSNDRVAGEPVVRIESPVISASRHWAAIVSTTAASSNLTKRLVFDGAAILSVGDTLATPPARIASILNLAGSADNLALLLGLEQMQWPQPATGRAVLRNGVVVLLSGAPLDALGFPAGTLCRTIYSIGANSHDTVVALVETTTFDLALVRLEFDEQGVNVGRTADLRTGQTLPDGHFVSVFDIAGQSEFPQAVNEEGNWMWRATASDGRERLVTRDGVLLRTGDPSPVPGRSILSFHPTAYATHSHDLDDLGGYAAVVLLSGDPASDELLIKNGAKLAQEGDVLPSLAPAALDEIVVTSLRLSDSGHVYWVALTNAPSGYDSALMRDLDVVVRLNATQVQNQPVTAISALDFEITPGGRYLLGRVNVNTDRVLLRIDLGAAEPIHGCVPNPGTLRHTAGTVLTGNTIRLTLDGPAPLGSFVRLQTSLGEASPGNPCGIPSPFGEILIDPARRLASFSAGIYTSGPRHLDVAIPADPTLVDLELFAQGSLVRPGSAAVFTNGMRFVIGAV